MDPILQEALTAVKAAYANAGLLGGLGAGLTLLLRVYQSETITNLLPAQARWESLPQAAKLLLPFLLSGAGAVLVAVSGGTSVLAALIAALPVAISSILAHHATKAAGAVMPDTLPARKALSLLVPMPKPKDDQGEAP